jgi:adenosylcobyric acid synthase
VRGLLVGGTSSDAGKSVLTAGICRWLARGGVRVAPFKAQNMSNNSGVAADGAEIGRAQLLQAAACGVPAEAAMNPVLLKPGSDMRSHVVLLGRPAGEVSALGYRERAVALRATALGALDDLAARFDVVVCEGAGSVAEINLRSTDIANLGLASARGLPVVVVADIDRGGVLASLAGSLALLAPADQRLVAGFVINKFRGDERLLEPGLVELRRLTARPTLGVVPWLELPAVDAEDSLSLVAVPVPLPPAGRDVLGVAAVRLPRTSNATDVDALASEPGVEVRWTASPAEVAAADLVVLPGTRATVDDLAWLHARGLADAVRARAAAARPVLGVCGGYQMLARTITDDVESRSGTVAGLGLLPVDVRFRAEKVLGRPAGEAYGEPVTTAYEIHHGVAVVDDGAQPFVGGCRVGAVWGTTWHGALESDGFRRAFLREVAAVAGRDFTPAPDAAYADVRERYLDALGDLVEQHLDTGALRALIDHGPPAGLPVVSLTAGRSTDA